MSQQHPITGGLRARVNAVGLKVIQQHEEFIATLMPDADPERSRYPESEFRKHWLPIISGEAVKNLRPGYTAEDLANDTHRYWSQIAGGVSREVEVIDSNGEVAFIVPALADTSALNIAQSRTEPGLKILQDEVLKDVQGRPDVADARMINGLERKIAHMTSAGTGDRKRTIERINKMHEYYGLKTDKPEEKKVGGMSDFMGEMSFD